MSVSVNQSLTAPKLTLLQIIQKACRRIGIGAPSFVIGSADLQILQLLELANEEGEELSTGDSVGLSYDWQALQREASFTTITSESQGNIGVIAPGFKRIIRETIWDRSTRMPVYGSLTPSEWQNYKSWGLNSPFHKYRIRGDELLLLPTPEAGLSYYFEYQTSRWCSSGNGAVLQTEWLADDDVPLLDGDLIVAGIVWRWKQAKGFDYAEDFRKYQTRVTNAIASDVERPRLNMGGTDCDSTGVVIPIGSWNA